jgi:hypothetical protein
MRRAITVNTVNTQIKIDLEDWNEVEELLRAMESLRCKNQKCTMC